MIPGLASYLDESECDYSFLFLFFNYAVFSGEFEEALDEFYSFYFR